MIEREVALRILGVEEGADRGEIDAAYNAVRAHVEQRLGQSTSEAEREARRAELRDLEGVHRSAISPSTVVQAPLYREVVTETRPPRLYSNVPRWLLGWAIVASIAAACLVVFLFFVPGRFGPSVLIGGSGGGSGGGGGGYALEGEGGEGEPTGDGDEAGSVGVVEPAGARAQVVVKSEVQGARLRIIRREGEAAPEVVAEGETDETVYYLAPGSYALEVEHADCKDTWRRDIAVGGGETHRFDPEVCRATGWVSVRSDQPNDDVSIDGRRVGSSADARHAVSAGEHEVRVEKEGYEPWEGVVAVVPGKVTGIRPRLGLLQKQERRKPKQPEAQSASASQQGEEKPDKLRELGGWYEETTQWLLANYDEDRSGRLDSEEEIAAVPCDQWLSLERSYDASGLRLSMTHFYGFDGDGWVDDALGVDNGYRDIAYERMQECGLR